MRKTDSSTPKAVVLGNAPETVTVLSVQHLRTAHYAVYRVKDTDERSWVARVGVVSAEDDAPVDNSGYLGTSALSPTGQMREHVIASGLYAVNADVCPSQHYARTVDGFDVLWLPFIDGIETAITAAQWHRALSGMHLYTPDTELPVFTNRIKTLDRIAQLPSDMQKGLRTTYDSQLADLFKVASKWSVVHGDAHCGNAINTGDRAVLFDFDTACWAPSVWDLTHLINRAGTGNNTGYTVNDLTARFAFTGDELDAALRLRRTAAMVAKLHRGYSV